MDFFIIENGQQVGPLTIAQLAEKKITSSTLVWKEGMANWQPAWEVQELRYILNENAGNSGNGNQPNVPPIPPTANTEGFATSAPQPPHNNENVEEKPKQKKSNKKIWKLIGAVIILLFLILAFTNPNRDDHEEAVRTEVNGAIDKMTENSDNNFFTQGIRMVAKMMADNVLGTALDQLFQYHNYIIFSKGTVELDGKSHTISYGILGKVFTLNADDMVKALEDNDNIRIDESSSSTESDGNIDNDDEQTDDNAVDNGSSSDDETSNADQSKLEENANKAIDRVADKVSKKVEEKINKKLEEVTDSSTLDKIIDKILNLI